MFSLPARVLGSFVVAVLAVGCASKSTDEGSTADQLQAAAGLHVTGAKAQRLINAFGLLEATDDAMGGRASVDVSKVLVLTHANSALDEQDPDFLVPSTTATFDVANQNPAHHEVTDAKAVSQVLFDALAAVDESLADSGMGKTFVTVPKVSCEGQGPGAGDDPKNPPPTTATCKVTGDAGKTFTVDGAKALRIVQAFGLAEPDAIDHAMGGRFGVDAANVTCERRANTALDESDPMFEIPAYSCKGDVPQAKSFSVDDKTPTAAALAKALELAGLQADSGMGTTGVSSAKVSCAVGPGNPAHCTLARQ
jgi:hypothetical protein